MMQFSSEKISDKFIEVNSCDVLDMKNRSCRTLRESGRVDYYIMYLLKGCCTVVEGQEEQCAKVGDLILYRPRERQEYYFDGKDQSVYVYVHFSGTECDTVLRECSLSSRITSVGTSRKLEWLLREMVNEFYLKKEFWQTATASLLLQFFATAGREISNTEAPKWTPELDSVIKHMHQHCEQNRPLTFYAAMCHLSEGRFSHVFKQTTGMAPKQYLLKIKVDTACRLLSATSLSIADIAQSVGIEDINYFGRLVKKQTGKTPRQLR